MTQYATNFTDRAEEWHDQYVRDDNTRWIPRDVAEARGEFQEAIELHDKPSVLRSIITRIFL
jgi:hypothetical protein